MTKQDMQITERTEEGGWQLHPNFRRLTLHHASYPSYDSGSIALYLEPSGSSKLSMFYLSYTNYTILPSTIYL